MPSSQNRYSLKALFPNQMARRRFLTAVAPVLAAGPTAASCASIAAKPMPETHPQVQVPWPSQSEWSDDGQLWVAPPSNTKDDASET
jgi:hypothetical protein